MKQATVWMGSHALVAMLVWSTTALGQTSSSSSIGGGSRIGGGGTTGGAVGGSTGGYSLSGGSGVSAMGSSGLAMGAAGTSTSAGPGATYGGISSTSSTGISNMDPFYSHYANPMYSGRVSASGQTLTGQVGGFATPLYTLSQTTPGGLGGITGTLSSTPSISGGLGGYTTGRRGPAYTCAVTFPYDPPIPSRLQTELQQIISQSSALTLKNAIKIKLDGQVFVLEGTVANDRERRLAEGLARLTPGVRQVRNALVVKESRATSKAGS